MARLDDDELNINPEVAAALGYPQQGNARGRRNARAGAQLRHIPRIPAEEETTGLFVFLTTMTIAVLIWLAAVQAPHHQATAEPSQQVSQQSVPVVDKQERQSDAIPVGTAESAPGVSDPAPQVPVQRDDVQPAQEIQHAALDIGNNETAENPDIQVNQRNDTPQYLPADYDIGGTTSPTFLAREMPHGGAVDFLGYIPAGICLLYERANANGWRRVVSFDRRYAGYAQVYPTVAYQQRPMQPGFLEAIEMIRRIP